MPMDLGNLEKSSTPFSYKESRTGILDRRVGSPIIGRLTDGSQVEKACLMLSAEQESERIVV